MRVATARDGGGGGAARVGREQAKHAGQQGQRQLASGGAGDRRAVGAPDPDADGMARVEAERPGVPAAPTGAGLPGDSGGAAFREGLRQNVRYNGGRSGLQERNGGGRRRGEQPERDGRAVGRQVGVQAGEVAQGDARAPERQREGRHRAGAQAQHDPGGAQGGRETLGSDAVEQRHGGHVERSAQGLGGGDAAGEAAIEILRGIAAEAARGVVQHRVRPGDAVLERHGVDERLQRRSRRAHRLSEVERSAPALPGARRAGQDGADFARRGVGDDDGERDPLGEGQHAFGGQPLQRNLQRQVQCGIDAGRVRQ